MALPTTREAFKEYCLRELGKPVIDINVDNTQVEDRIDDALQYYRDYHYDGTLRTYVKQSLTATDITNEYISLDDDIVGIVNMFDIGDSVSSNNLFNMRYQLSLHDVWGMRAGGNMTNYYMAQQHISLMEEILVGKAPLRFNRNMNRVHVDMDWGKVVAGNYMIFEAYQTVDPDTYGDIWKDRWLLRYAAQLIKKQWGSNLSKFNGMTLPGGLTFNGAEIYQQAVEEITRLEEEMISSYSLPVYDLMG
jgi:hypothetical protein